jgi:hypothetical protein
MCTIAGAKVQRNYNCYNVYFYECLRLIVIDRRDINASPLELVNESLVVIFGPSLTLSTPPIVCIPL